MTEVPIRFSGGGLKQAIAFLAACVFSGTVHAQQEVPFGLAGTMPYGRAMHGAAVLGDNLYVFGGNAESARKETRNEGSFTSDVIRVPILADGRLGQWVPDRAMPQVRAYVTNSTVALNDMVYIVGGTDGLEDVGKEGTKYKTVLISRPAPTGELQPWIESSPFPGPPVSCITACATPGFIHLIGGRTDAQEATNLVRTGVLAADGTIMMWEQGPPLPEPLWFHHSAVAAGRVWTWGGLNGAGSSSATTAVYSSPISGSGRLAAWRKEAVVLPQPIYRGATAVAGPFLMTFAPSYAGNQASADVLHNFVTPRGLGQWSKTNTPLPMKLYTTCAPDYRRGAIYIVGGQPDLNSPGTNAVIFFRLTKAARQTITTYNSADEVSQSSEIGETKVGERQQLGSEAVKVIGEGALPGFLPYDEARRQLATANRPMIAYFHLKGSPPSEAQKARLAADPALPAVIDKAILTWVDVKEAPQIAQQFGIFRAPAWILFDKSGRELGRAAKPLGAAELNAGISSVK